VTLAANQKIERNPKPGLDGEGHLHTQGGAFANLIEILLADSDVRSKALLIAPITIPAMPRMVPAMT
jgi:hypothetical protein